LAYSPRIEVYRAEQCNGRQGNQIYVLAWSVDMKMIDFLVHLNVAVRSFCDNFELHVASQLAVHSWVESKAFE
jgi:hypothetical protein